VRIGDAHQLRVTHFQKRQFSDVRSPDAIEQLAVRGERGGREVGARDAPFLRVQAGERSTDSSELMR